MCKKVGHYASKFEEEVPIKTPKNGSSVEITTEESSMEPCHDAKDDDG